MIDQSTIDRIINAADIVDVVSQFVTLKRRGVNFVGLCPFHEDKTPSFYVSPAKGICKCFACGEGGTSVHFIMKHEQLSYFDALRFLGKKYNIEIEERELTDDERRAHSERESLFILNEYARDYFVKTLHEHIEGKSIGLSYFRERGFRDDIIEKFQLGYSLEDRDAFTQEAIRAGYKKEYLVKTGLTIEGDNYTADRFRGRVMFPVHTLSGKVIAFGGRILKKNDKTAKYVNSPESDIYHKGNELYGIFFAKKAITKEDRCYLVEGYTDVISMYQAGIENVVSSSGTALTQGQIKLIHRFTNNVTVLYDGDAAGIKAALRGIDLLLEQGLNIKVVLLPDGEDPDSFARKQNAESLRKYLKGKEVDFIRFKTQLLLDEAGEDPIKRAQLITDIVDSISVIPDNIIRTVYIRDCSRLLEIAEDVLVREVNKKRHKHLDQQYKDTRQSAEPFYPPEDAVYVSPQSNTKKVKTEISITTHELAVLYYIIRFGKEVLVEEESGPLNVIDFVKLDLEQDGLWLTHPAYKQILEESITHSSEENFVPSRYFLAHPDPEISRIAVELVSDRYELSKVHAPINEEEGLQKSVPQALAVLKNYYVQQRINKIMEEIAVKGKEGDDMAVTALLKEMKELQQRIKAPLNKFLGERIVLPK